MELAQVLDTFEPLLLDLIDVILKVQRLQNSLMTSLVGSILLLETFEDVAYTQTIA